MIDLMNKYYGIITKPIATTKLIKKFSMIGKGYYGFWLVQSKSKLLKWSDEPQCLGVRATHAMLSFICNVLGQKH